MVLNLVYVLRKKDHVILSCIRAMGGANRSKPTYSKRTYEIGARLFVAGVIFQLVVIDVLIYLALFNHEAFIWLVGK